MGYTYYGKDYCRNKECGTCKHFTGKRDIRIDSYCENINVQVDNNGVCTKQHKNPIVNCRSSCFSYEHSPDIAIGILKIEAQQQECALARQQKENKKIENDLRKEKNRHDCEMQHITSSQDYNSQSIIKYNEWYNSLTPEEQQIENERKRTEAELQSKKIKKFIYSAAIILAIFIAVFSIVKIATNIKFKNSPTGQIVSWIQDNGDEYQYIMNYSLDGYKIKYILEYYPDGYEFGDYIYDFIATVYLKPSGIPEYNECIGIVLFNYGEVNKSYLQGTIKYNDCTIYAHFTNYILETCPDIKRNGVWYDTEGTNQSRDKTTATEDSWKAIKVALVFTNGIFKDINSEYSLW